MTAAFDTEQGEDVGELDIVLEGQTTVECDLVLMPNWKTDLPSRLTAKVV